MNLVSLPLPPLPEIAAFVAHMPRQHHLVHLVGAVDAAGLPRIAIDPFEHRVLGIATRAIELDCDVGGMVQRVGDMHRGHRHLLAGAIALVEQPRSVHHQEPPDLDAMRDVAELDLHALTIRKLHTEAFALIHVSLRDLAAALGEPRPAHAMGEPRRPEPDLGDAQPVTEAHQHVFVGDLEALEDKLAMPAVLLRPHDRNPPDDLEAGLVAMKQKSREAAARIVRGAGNQNEMIGNAGAGDEPLMAADHPAVALLLSAGTDHAGIGAAAGRGLGHRKSRAHFALDDRAQPLVLLRRRADQRQHIHIAVIGRRAIEHDRAEDRAVRLLIHRGPADDRQTHAAEILRCLRRPQALRFRLLAYAREQIEPDVLMVVVVGPIGLERQHLLFNKGARAPADVRDLIGQREIHGTTFHIVACDTHKHSVRAHLARGHVIMANFTPLSAAIGGALIGLAAVLLMLTTGRIAGISGIFGGLINASIPDKGWRLAFIAGLILAPLSGTLAGYAPSEPQMPAGSARVVIAGSLVGFGPRLGSGCTSGHGICGVSRLSPRSIVATAVFMAVAIVVVAITRHGLGG